MLHFFPLLSRVVIRGERHEDAVLCTEDKTYDLRLAETSNSLLICPALIYPTDASMLLLIQRSCSIPRSMLCLFSSVLTDFGVHSGDTVLPKQVGVVIVIEQVGSFAWLHAFWLLWSGRCSKAAVIDIRAWVSCSDELVQ